MRAKLLNPFIKFLNSSIGALIIYRDAKKLQA